MTLENLNYRTNPMFLRNQFNSSNLYEIPDIPKVEFTDEDFKDLRLLAFNQTKSDDGLHNERIVHFFLYDYNFENVWKDTEKYIELLSKYKGVLTPDFSMYTEMPYAVQIYNTFRNRWCGAYMASKGIKVIPIVAWSDSGSFDFCFQGIPKGSVVAVSTYMFHESDHHEAQKELFMEGYNKMLEEIEPSAIICYSEPFPEMKGNIIYIDYELSSWKHLSDEKSLENTLNNIKKTDIIVKRYGYVCKGGGSANGGDWKPKDENSERFKGPPDSIKENSIKTKKGGYNTLDKYDSNGKATHERHNTDHGRPDKHSNPHDHMVDWDKGYPNLSPLNNYPNGEAPSFFDFIEGLIEAIGGETEKMVVNYNSNEHNFDSLGEFKIYLSCGANVGFEYNGIEYGIEGHNNKFDIWIYNKGDIANSLSLEEVLNYKLDGVKIRDLILTAEITERIM